MPTLRAAGRLRPALSVVYSDTFPPMQAKTPTPIDTSSEQLQLGPMSGWAENAVALLGVAGFLVVILCSGLIGKVDEYSGPLFMNACLAVFTFYLAIVLGAIFFVMLHHLARSGWSVAPRRLAEAISANIVILVPCAIVGLMILDGYYNRLGWLAVPAVGTADVKPTTAAAYMGRTWLAARFIAYFAIWTFLAWFFRSRSIRQDADGDVRHSRAMERMAAVGMVLFGLTITLAAVDLVMSLNPGWTSTAIGVYFFSDAMVSSLAAIILLAVWLQSRGRLRDVITAEHYHDLGKLLFAFVVFWGYIAFSQYMLIWYANMPGETRFYLPRQQGPWAAVSLALLFGNLLIPMCGLLSRHVKRRKQLLAFWAAWLLASVLLDFFWLMMPAIATWSMPDPSGPKPSLAWLPLEPRAIGMFLGLTVALGIVLFLNTLRLLRQAPLAPVGDPRWKESLAFENL